MIKITIKNIFKVPLYSNSLYLIINMVVTALLGYPFWIIVARYYSTSNVGYASAILSFVSIIVLLSMVGLDTSLVRYLARNKDKPKLINSYLIISGIVSLLITIIGIISVNIWSSELSFMKSEWSYFLIVIGIVVLSVFSNLVDNIFIALSKSSFMMIKNTIFSMVKLVLPITLVLLFKSSGIILSILIALIIMVIISLFVLLPRIQKGYKPFIGTDSSSIVETIKSVWVFAGYNYIVNIVMSVSTLVLPVMVINLLGSVSNAYFYIGWVLGGILFGISYAVSLSFFSGCSSDQNNLCAYLRKSIKLVYILLVPCICGMILLGRWILNIFGSDYANNSYGLLVILAIASIPLAFNHIYMVILKVVGKLKELLVLCVIMSVILVVGSYIVLPAIGIVGIGYIYCGVNILIAVYVLIFRKNIWSV